MHAALLSLLVAQTFLFEDFETPGFVASDAGFTSYRDLDAVSVFEWTSDSGVVMGTQALRVQRTATTGTGAASSDSLVNTFAAHPGTVSAQAWIRVESTSGTWGAWPIQLHGLNNPNGTNAELYVRGTTPVMLLQAGGRLGLRPCTSTTTLPLDGQFHLVELITSGNGTDPGVARGFLDGVEFCSETNDWSGYPIYRAFTGTSAFDRAWVGAMVVDAYRVSDGVPVDRVFAELPRLTGTEGECLPLTLDAVGIDDAGVLDRTVVVELKVLASDGGALHLDDVFCDAGAGAAAFASSTDFGLALERAGEVDVRFVSEALLPTGAFHLQILPAPVPDAGVPDAGDIDAGTPVDAGVPEVDAGSVDVDAGVQLPLVLQVGCGCGATSMPTVLFALSVLTLRRRR